LQARSLPVLCSDWVFTQCGPGRWWRSRASRWTGIEFGLIFAGIYGYYRFRTNEGRRRTRCFGRFRHWIRKAVRMVAAPYRLFWNATCCRNSKTDAAKAVKRRGRRFIFLQDLMLSVNTGRVAPIPGRRFGRQQSVLISDVQASTWYYINLPFACIARLSS